MCVQSINIIFKQDTNYSQWIQLLALSVILPRFKFLNILEKNINFKFVLYVLHNSHYKTSWFHGMGSILITTLFSRLCTSATYLFTWVYIVNCQIVWWSDEGLHKNCLLFVSCLYELWKFRQTEVKVSNVTSHKHHFTICQIVPCKYTRGSTWQSNAVTILC